MTSVTQDKMQCYANIVWQDEFSKYLLQNRKAGMNFNSFQWWIILREAKTDQVRKLEPRDKTRWQLTVWPLPTLVCLQNKCVRWESDSSNCLIYLIAFPWPTRGSDHTSKLEKATFNVHWILIHAYILQREKLNIRSLFLTDCFTKYKL